MTVRRRPRDGGSAVIWVVACCLLIFGIGYAAVIRTEAVLARHRAESAADLAALAAAGQIGVSGQICPAAARIATANAATLTACRTSLAIDGRSGTVAVTVRLTVDLPGFGRQLVQASARAGRFRAVQ